MGIKVIVRHITLHYNEKSIYSGDRIPVWLGSLALALLTRGSVQALTVPYNCTLETGTFLPDILLVGH